MSATDARERLEAVINQQLTRAWKYGLDHAAPRPRPADVILAAVDALPQPPHWAGLTAEDSCGATDIPDHSDGLDYICTAQEGHAMPHLAHDADGRIMHAWDDGRPA